MTSNKRRKFTGEFRSQVALEVLSSTLSVAQAAKKYKIRVRRVRLENEAAAARQHLLKKENVLQ